MTQQYRKDPTEKPDDEDIVEDIEDTGEDDDISENEDISSIDEDTDEDVGEGISSIRGLRQGHDPEAQRGTTDPDVNREENEGGKPEPRAGY